MKRLLFRTGFAVLLVFLSSISAQANVTLNENNFPDANFRAALSTITGVAEGGSINESTLTELDVSNKGITNLTGLENLTSLTDLDISDNNLTTGANISGLTALVTLKANNCNIRTLAETYETYNSVRYAGLIIGNGNVNLKYLDLSNNVRFNTSGNLQYLTHLETLLLKDCTYYDFWGTPGLHMSSLKWVDVSGCTAMDRVFLPAATQLKHLNASGTKVTGFSSSASSQQSTSGYIVLSIGLSTLEYLNLANCSSFDSFQAIANHYHVTSLDTLILTNDTGIDGWSPGITAQTGLKYCDLTNTRQTNETVGFTSAFTSLETLILANNSGFQWSETLRHLRALKYLDISHCDLYFRGDGHLLDYLTSSNNPNLETLIANSSKMGPLTEGLTGFSNLKTVDISGNPNVVQFWVNGSPLLETLDLHGNTGLKILGLENGGYPRTNLTIDDSNCNALTGLKLNNNGYGSVALAMSNATAWGLDNIQFLYLESNSGFTDGPLTLGANDCGNLHGLDLGNNGFTSFSAPTLPSTLTALMIGDNPSMTRLEMHNNPGIKTMTANPTMSDGSGLYLLGNTGLTYMDISGTADQPNYFQRIGNNFSLANVPIDTLKASHNQFYTFRNLSVVSTRNGWEVWKNGQYGWIDYNQSYSPASDGYVYGYWPPSPAQPDSASLEQLTNLKYLDLSYCNLKDSVHLHKNRELRYLDVSHNRTIERIYEKPEHDKGWDYRNAPDDGTADKRSFPDYKKYLWLKDPNSTGLEPFTGEYNDTTGLYDLDLAYNNKLEYLDISYTGIEQTAAQHCYVANARYVWIQDLPNLKYLYADYNGMRSMGIGTKNGRFYQEGLKSLERLSVIGMRGTDNKTMKGSINFKSPDDPVSPSPCVKLHYINLSYSNFDSIGVYNPSVDTIIIKGNPLHYVNVQSLPLITYVDARGCAFKMRGYDTETGRTYPPDVDVYKNGARKNGWYTDDNTNDFPNHDPNGYIVTSPFSGLRGVKAYRRPELTTLLLDSCNALTFVYAFENPKLPKIHGFEHLAYPKAEVDAQFNYPTDLDSLNLVWVNDNKVFNELNLTKNNNLKYLHAYNDSTLGTTLGGNGMDLTTNKNLVSAWVSNSRLERFVNDAGQHLDTLKIWQNPELDHLDVSDNGNLRYFDLRNCMIRTLNLDNNKKLTYFDCSNRDSIWTDYEHFTFNMPGSVPTVIDDPGKNSIADLHFKSDSLRVVHADNNDLYCMDGLSTNHKLYKLTYSYNHINAIDLSGCDSLVNDNNYNCYHNVRGLIPGELSSWKTTVNNVTTEHNLYYFQLEKNAGDGLNGHNTFLGIKCGQDSLLSDQTSGYERQLEADGFDPTKVIVFTKNSSGPHHGSRTPASGAPMRVNVDPSEQLDPESFYGTIAILNKYDLERNYIEYIYDDQRPSHRNRDGGGSAFGIAWNPPGIPTVVDETAADDLGELTVVSERYFDAAGAEHSEPVSGVNIIVRQMSDGSTETVKVIK